MTTLQTAIDFARDSKITDFKDVIHTLMASKVQDSLSLKKLQMAGNMFNKHDDAEETSSNEFRSETEETTDEEL